MQFQGGLCAGGRRNLAGNAWHRNAALSGAASTRARASAAGNPGVHGGYNTCGEHVPRPNNSAAAISRCGAGSMIKTEIVDGIAILTLTHGKANTLDTEFCDALASRFADQRGSDAKAVMLTGQGRIFSAGVDLKRV